MDKELQCVIEQLKQEKETTETLRSMGNDVMDGRCQQIIERRKAQVRRRFGLSMDNLEV